MMTCSMVGFNVPDQRPTLFKRRSSRDWIKPATLMDMQAAISQQTPAKKAIPSSRLKGRNNNHTSPNKGARRGLRQRESAERIN